MADKHPYMSGSGGVTQLVTQLKKSFPATVTADTLKKLGIAPNNETYLLNIFRFIGVLDAENKKVPDAGTVFNKHNVAEFQEGFAGLVQKAYHELFDLHGPEAWSLDLDKLISFFRNHDETSDIVGRRQATTFQALAKVSGKVSEEATAVTSSAKPVKATRAATNKQPASKKSVTVAAPPVPPPAPAPQVHVGTQGQMQPPSGVALTVRVEINLPAGGDQATYDAIFKSIRENLMNGNGA